VRSLNAELPMSFRTLDEVFSSSLDQRRFSLVIFGAFAAVTQRTQEIGIRVALGARPRDVVKLVVVKGLALTSVGVGTGVAAAFALTRLMASLLYGVSGTDAATFASVPLLLAVAAAVARVDPVIALRYE
jgi:putative ABC transport system permease protein